MNKFMEGLFILFIPFYPFWYWICSYFTSKNFGFFFSLLLSPICLYCITFKKRWCPKYLFLFILFTIYHIFSVFINQIKQPDENWIFFLFSDTNVIACIVLIIAENTIFTDIFINRMNQYIFLIVVVSLIVSLIQIKNPAFFFTNSTSPDTGLGYIEQDRNFSIYSWINYHTLGISLPIMISILLSAYYNNKKPFKSLLLVMIGFIICFLSRYRFAMISAIIVSLQLVFVKSRNLYGRLSILFLGIGSILVLGFVAESSGYKIEEVIESRILETGSDMGSAKARITSYDVFLEKYPEHPWFGVGPKTRDDVVSLLNNETPVIHVGYLSYLYFYGIFGALLLFSSLFYLLKRAWMVGKTMGFWGSFYGLVAFCVANFAFVYFNYSEMGIVLAVIYLRYFHYKSSLRLAQTQ